MKFIFEATKSDGYLLSGERDYKYSFKYNDTEIKVKYSRWAKTCKLSVHKGGELVEAADVDLTEGQRRILEGGQVFQPGTSSGYRTKYTVSEESYGIGGFTKSKLFRRGARLCRSLSFEEKRAFDKSLYQLQDVVIACAVKSLVNRCKTEGIEVYEPTADEAKSWRKLSDVTDCLKAGLEKKKSEITRAVSAVVSAGLFDGKPSMAKELLASEADSAPGKGEATSPAEEAAAAAPAAAAATTDDESEVTRPSAG